ncbi:hypothetical protein AAG747_05525 [Rapidithrix thailandica]|uniref:Uncharacterized protein n=1 Tax=Rapidithrix thailandica TaxID=413964 RepID=A0AAW9S6M9_9BACT
MKNHFEIREVKKEDKRTSFDFFVDGKALSEWLNINRFDLAFCDFDLDLVEVDKSKFPNYNRTKINKKAASRFLGNDQPPFNQFETNRIVLYRCHCGVDYCGIISFLLEKQDDLIIWKEITYENEDFIYVENKSYENDGFNCKEEIESKGLKPIKELRFDRSKYELEFKNYLNNYCA